jgi:hypothetical protein
MPPGRPRTLDKVKQGEICAMIAAGCSIREAAKYVRCDRTTIVREARRSAEFRNALDRAVMTADLHPLKAMQKAARKNWRAAAWMLERTKRERFGRHEPRACRPRQARKLLRELIETIDVEVGDPILAQVLRQRIRIKIEEAVPGTIESRPSGFEIRRSIRFLDDLERRRQTDPDRANFDPLGSRKPPWPPPNDAPRPPDDVPLPSDEGEAAPQTAAELMAQLSECFRERREQRTQSEQPGSQNVSPAKAMCDGDTCGVAIPAPPEPPKDPFLHGRTIVPAAPTTEPSEPAII